MVMRFSIYDSIDIEPSALKWIRIINIKGKHVELSN